MVTKQTKIEKSDKHYDLNDLEDDIDYEVAPKTICIKDIPAFEKVTISVSCW